jgi:autotransporter-associated beta strand protein
MSMTTTNYTDSGLGLNSVYYYEVVAMNAAGVSGSSAVVNTAPAPPASLNASPGNSQITLTWAASSGATNYIIKRGTSSGNETTTLVTTASTTYTDTNLVNDTTYYYVVIASSSSGNSANSPEASATPSVGAAAGLVWIGAVSSAWDTTTTNWLNGGVAAIYANGSAVYFNDSPVSSNIVISSAVTPASVTFANSNATYNVSAATVGISGTASVVKTNAGTVTFSGTNTYTGGTFVNGGTLVFSNGAAIPSTGTLTLNNTGAVTVVTASGLPNVLVKGTNAITGNGNSGTGIAMLDDEGTMTLFTSGGSKVFDLTGTMTGPGTLGLGTSGMTLRFNGTSGDGSAIFNLGTGANFASVRSTSTTAIALGGLTGGASTQLQGDNSGGGANMTYTIGGAGANTEFDGIILNGTVGTVAVTKTGGNTQTFTNANTYTGGTTINGGTLLVNNSTGSGTGSGGVTVASGGTLGGNGIISGAVTVNSGGTLAPGSNSIGTLTFSNSLTLAAGSTNIFAVSKSPLTNNIAKILGTWTGGGTLVVTKTGATALAAGDTFKLFNAAGYSGAFANVVLPALPAGLGWNTTALDTGGTLSVVIATVPVVGPVSISGGGLVFNGSGGVANANYYLLASTNMAAPLASWTRLLTNQFDSNGNFDFTNPMDTNALQNFYLLQVP